MSRETKIQNIDKQIGLNLEKIRKLLLINSELEQSKANLVKPKEKPPVPTEEQKTEQSRKDKEKFKSKLKYNPILDLKLEALKRQDR